MGCGRVGSALADKLDAAGHSVSIIDQDVGAFKKLSPEFSGTTITGVGFDRDRLKKAGIEKADAFAAVSSGDNSNIISARVARETFGVQNVIARIYDPRRAEIYQRLGIETVATVAWTTQQFLRRLVPLATEEFRDATGTLTLAELPYNPAWIGQRVAKLGKDSGARIAFINRMGAAVLPDQATVIQANDIIHAILRLDEQSEVLRVFAGEPEE